MTTSLASERARAAAGGEGTATTVRGALAHALLERARAVGQLAPTWPAVRYQRDPARFCREILGLALMPEQLEILEAIRDQRRVAISGGRKVGKDFVVAAAALWVFCSFPHARVQFTAVTERQVQRVFWRQVCEHVLGAGRCLTCKREDPTGPLPCAHSALILEDTPATLARTGIKASDQRELVGYTAQEAAGIRGISGDCILDIIDEASDVDDGIIATLDGNKAGSAFGRTVLLSNPTTDQGQFYRAFHEEQHLWKTFTRDALEIAKKYGGRIPGIARVDEIAELVEKYGEESDFVTIHVRGRFVQHAQGRIFSVKSIEAAQSRLATSSDDGPLVIGVDVAGETGTGDESAFAARRALRILSLIAKRGLTAEAHLAIVLGIIHENPRRDPTEVPTVVIDRGGEPGSRVWGTFIAHRQALWQDPPFRLVGVDSSRKAQRDPKAYHLVRDELVASLADWVRRGGGIPADPMLAAELNVLRWIEQRIQAANRLIDKKEIRKILSRSPDRADAVALSCWDEPRYSPATATDAATPAADMQDANAIWYEPTPGAAVGDEGGSPWWPSE